MSELGAVWPAMDLFCSDIGQSPTVTGPFIPQLEVLPHERVQGINANASSATFNANVRTVWLTNDGWIGHKNITRWHSVDHTDRAFTFESC